MDSNENMCGQGNLKRKFIDVILVLAPLAAKFIPLPACNKCFATVPAHTHIAVLIREHKGKAYLHHDKQGMEVPDDNGGIFFKCYPVRWGYVAE